MERVLIKKKSVDPLRLLSLAQLVDLLGVSSSTIKRAIENEGFPAPIWFSASNHKWRAVQVDAWLTERQKASVYAPRRKRPSGLKGRDLNKHEVV